MNIQQLASLNVDVLPRIIHQPIIYISPHYFKKLLIDPIFIEELNICDLSVEVQTYQYIQNNKLQHFHIVILSVNFYLHYITYGLSFESICNYLSRYYSFTTQGENYIYLQHYITTTIEVCKNYINCCQDDKNTYVIISTDTDNISYYDLYKFNTLSFDIIKYYQYIDIVTYSVSLEHRFFNILKNDRLIFNQLINELEPFKFVDSLI